MLIMFLVVMGVFSFVDLGVDLFPRSIRPRLCAVKLPGASPRK
jgi:multidrug efflux pump subunit AcrB